MTEKNLGNSSNMRVEYSSVPDRIYLVVVYYKDILRSLHFVGMTGADADLPICLELKRKMLLILGLIWLIA